MFELWLWWWRPSAENKPSAGFCSNVFRVTWPTSPLSCYLQKTLNASCLPENEHISIFSKLSSDQWKLQNWVGPAHLPRPSNQTASSLLLANRHHPQTVKHFHQFGSRPGPRPRPVPADKISHNALQHQLLLQFTCKPLFMSNASNSLSIP